MRQGQRTSVLRHGRAVRRIRADDSSRESELDERPPGGVRRWTSADMRRDTWALPLRLERGVRISHSQLRTVRQVMKVRLRPANAHIGCFLIASEIRRTLSSTPDMAVSTTRRARSQAR
jgi:hypothetical protein